MIVGYICGVIFIPRYLSQAAAMRICAIIALVGSVAVAVVPNPVISVYCIFLMALGCSLMWPALWPLAMADLGKFTKSGASLLTMAMAGGAVMPWLRGVVQDAFASGTVLSWLPESSFCGIIPWMRSIIQNAHAYQVSYWVSVPCFLFILYYGLVGYKIRTKKEDL